MTTIISSTYQTDLQQILQEHFEADDIPCEDFTAIFQAYQNGTRLTVDAVQASILTVIDESECGALPASLLTAIVTLLEKRVPAPPGKAVKKAVSKKKSGAKPASGAEPASGADPAGDTASIAATVTAPAPTVVKKGKKNPSVAATPPPTPPPTPTPVAVVSPVVDVPVKAMNQVARFSQMVSHVSNPGAYEAVLTPLLTTPVLLEDGFKRESPLFAMVSTTDLLSRVGQTVPFKSLTDAIKSQIPKPAVVTIAAIVRWFLSTATRESLLATFLALDLPVPVKKTVKRRAKAAPAAADGTTAAPKAKRVKKDPSEKRPAKGYSLFTQRIGGVLKGALPDYAATTITITDNFSEATRAKATGGYQKYTSLLTTGTLTAGGEYSIQALCDTSETKTSVVSVSGLIWGMCDATTRLRLSE